MMIDDGGTLNRQGRGSDRTESSIQCIHTYIHTYLRMEQQLQEKSR